jgi:hypothetical protein
MVGLSRRKALELGGLGLIGILMLGSASIALGRTSTSAYMLGIKPGNPAKKNRENLLKVLSNSVRSITLPPGDYCVDNSGPPYVVIHDFGGQLKMEPRARFVFTDNSSRGLVFTGGAGARFHGLRSAFKALPPTRMTAQECMYFERTTDTEVREVEIVGSAAAGLLFAQCIRPSVVGATIMQTRADGLHFANCQDAYADNVLTADTGDDGLAFLNYQYLRDYSGGVATNVTVKRSKARGIAVVGQRDVVIRGFSVEGSACSGLYCAQETSWNTRVPSEVLFVSGTVEDAGRLAGNPGCDKDGIHYANVRSVAFKDIMVLSPANRGVAGVSPGGKVTLDNVEVEDASGPKFDIG